LPLRWRDALSYPEIVVRVFRMCVRDRLEQYVPCPEILGGQPIRFMDIHFDGWVATADCHR
jgi:hypothetical protein